MSQRMNRQYRREMKREEQRRRKRIEAASRRRRQRRQRIVTRHRERVSARTATADGQGKPEKFQFRKWLTTPYKPADMIFLFVIFFGLRMLALVLAGGEEGAIEQPQLWEALNTGAVLLFGVILWLYLSRVAKEGFEWLGPPEARSHPVKAPMLGLLAGVGAWIIGQGVQALAPTLSALLRGGQGQGALGGPGFMTGLLFGAEFPGWLPLFFLLLAKPVVEELLYRRTLVRLFEKVGISQRMTIFLATLMFIVGQGSPAAMLAAIVPGTIFTVVYVHTRATATAVIGHITWMVITVLIG